MVKLLDHVVAADGSKVGPPILKETSYRRILLRIISGRNALLQKLPQNLRRIKGWIAGIRARNHRPCRGVANAIPRRSLGLSKKTRIIVQNMGQKAKDKKGRSGLICFRRAKALRVRSPALPIMGLPVAGLLQRGLKRIAKMGANVDRLVPCERVLLSDRHRLSRCRNVVLSLKVRNNSQDALGVVVLLRIGVRRL